MIAYPRFLFLALLLLPFTTHGVTLQAEARAASKELAQQQALSDLANSIFVNVQSVSSSYVEGSGKRADAITIKSSSDLPLIGQTSIVIQLGMMWFASELG